MPYSVNNTDSSQNFTVQDGTIDNSTLSISLIGTNAENYADDIARNDVQLLENFANTSAPLPGTILTGQLWYDKTDNVLRVYNGTLDGWVNLQPLVLGTEPTGTGARKNKKGELYFNTSNNKFYVFDGANWKVTGYAGEETSSQSSNSDLNNPTKFGSKVRSIFLKDTSGVPRPCLALVFVNDSTTNEFYSAGTNGETIMAIFNHTTTFTADNVLSETEGENINYYAELNATGSIGVTINKGMNLRKDYVAEAVALATEAITAQKANALFRGGQVVSASSIITEDISWIPTGTTGTLSLGQNFASGNQYFDTFFGQRISLGHSTDNTIGNSQWEISTEHDNLGIIGSTSKAIADIFTYDLRANANVNVGEILSVTGNSNLVGNVDITNNLQVDKNITSSQIITGLTVTDGTLSINSGSIASGVNATFSDRVTFGDLFDGSISIVQFDGSTSLGTNADRVPTQSAVKTYVDTANANMKTYVDIQDNAQDLDITTDSGTIDILVNSETLTIAGGDGIGSSATGTTATLAVDNTVVRTSGAQSIAGVKTFSDNAIFSGNLTVNGTQTTVNSATLSIADNKITLNSDYTGSGPSENAGIEVERGSLNNAVLRWNESTDKWQFTNDGSTYSDITTFTNFSVTSGSASGNGALSYNNGTGAFTFTPADTSLSTKSTTNLSEGTNLYFTNARANTVIGTNNLSNLLNVSSATPSANQVLQWNGSAWAPATTAAGVTDLGDLGDVFTGGATTGQVLQRAANGNFNFGSVSTANNYADSLAFATGTGVLTVGRNGLGDLTVDLDGRYSTTDTQYSAATSSALGLIKIGYTENGKNYPVELDGDSEAFVNVPWTDTTYSLPLSSSSTRGGVKIGYAENGKNYPVELSSEKMFVNVPWTDSTGTDTTYTAGTGITLSGTEFSLTAVTEAADLATVSRRYINGLTLDGFGRVTGYSTGTETNQSFSDTNDYVNNMSFNTGNGILTLTRTDGGTITQDLDGAYLRSITSSQVTTALGFTPPSSDTNTTYSAGEGLQLSGTSFSMDGAYNGTFRVGSTTSHDISLSLIHI